MFLLIGKGTEDCDFLLSKYIFLKHVEFTKDLVGPSNAETKKIRQSW